MMDVKRHEALTDTLGEQGQLYQKKSQSLYNKTFMHTTQQIVHDEMGRSPPLQSYTSFTLLYSCCLMTCESDVSSKACSSHKVYILHTLFLQIVSLKFIHCMN